VCKIVVCKQHLRGCVFYEEIKKWFLQAVTCFHVYEKLTANLFKWPKNTRDI